ncbi:Vacuolar protein sorting-associated protein 53 like [Verticillium longisporum]|uniref:Vacuolar protein sorting-associated protein 53 like n=2 Tax=Verticillium longisporum TaxID=100787 RepID=A0A8I2ZAA8_VERLO|nr:Vacuolar protein sorting-associated protein 53 like [Verticillium longisporum]
MNGVALDDPTSLDAVDYDPIDHLNLLFSHPSTVTSISRVSQTLHEHKNDVSTDIAELELAQAYGPDSSLERMQSAQAELAQLFRKIETVRSRAIETEQNITSMTADIKRLDGTKRNLTLSMTALKRLQMLTTAYEQLQGHARTRQYRECASLLQAVLQLMKHFNSYRSIEQIATLSRGVSELQRTLLEQVCEDFELAFAKDEVSARRGTLVEACHVMDALGDAARSRLMTWYVNTELREYRQVFRGNDEAGSLDNIGRRYAWFKRMLKTHDDEHAAIFPPHWRANEMLAMAFCDGTREDFKGILERSMRRTEGPKLDVNLLLSCLQETLDFEHGLERRFADGPRASIDTLSSADDRASNFHGSISAAFEPYLSFQPLLPADEEFTPQACAKLSTSDRLLDLAKTLAKYLDEYAQQDIVMVMNTADFWDRVDLSSQADAFLGVASAAVLALVRTVEQDVGDQSSYVGELLRAVNGKAEAILGLVVKQQYARAFCDNLVDHMASAYIANIVQCKPVTEVAAEQMLLDKYVMTKAFEGLLSFHNKSGEAQAPPASFVKRVAHTMNRIDPLLKTLQVRPSPPEGLVQAYLIHIADRSDVNFKKILDLKAVRKQDQAHLLELFGIHRDSKANDGKLAQNSPLLTPLLASQSMSGGGHGGGGAGTVTGVAGASINTASSALSAAGSSATAMAGLQGKFDATSLGEKLLSAARDLGQGGVVGEKGAGGSGVVAAEKAMNENLKNFGKFFRRDLGGFGARFGKRDGADEGQR